MNFYIYSIAYFEELEPKEEKGIIVAGSYADAMAEIEEWELDVEEVRLREICGEYQGLDCERPWISAEDLKEVLEEAGIRFFDKSIHGCSCGKKDNGPMVPDCVGDCVNDK